MEISGTASKPATITHGVPQGPILGLLLFLIYFKCLGAKFDQSLSGDGMAENVANKSNISIGRSAAYIGTHTMAL